MDAAGFVKREGYGETLQSSLVSCVEAVCIVATSGWFVFLWSGAT